MEKTPIKEDTMRFETIVNRLVKSINNEDWKGVQVDFGPEMLKAIPLERLIYICNDILEVYGKIEKLGEPQYILSNKAVFPICFERAILDIHISLDTYNKVIGLLFQSHIPYIPEIKKHQTKLSLPFKGKWLVSAGGDTRELNRHHNIKSQKFAFDFVVTDETGKFYKNYGNATEDYFAFGKEVISPADGIVSDVVNGVRDNIFGSLNPYSIFGNTIIIKHFENEFSVLACLKLDSIKVKVGDKVTMGQLIGLCGNSGNSNRPHLHYHLQNAPIIQYGTGIRCIFNKVIVTRDGQTQTKTNYSPIKGDIVQLD